MVEDTSKSSPDNDTDAKSDSQCGPDPAASEKAEKEIGGRDGPDPTRYGDWEKDGRCIDF